MDHNDVLAELLFIISNYEKGRLPLKKRWSIEYINSLRESIRIMRIIVRLLGQEDVISTTDMGIIFGFIKKSTGVIFQSDIEKKVCSAYKTGVLRQCSEDKKKIELLQSMNNILYRCEVMLFEKKRGYKQKVVYLLMAFHNTPRAFLTYEKESYLGIRTSPLSVDDVKNYASSYLMSSDRKLQVF